MSELSLSFSRGSHSDGFPSPLTQSPRSLPDGNTSIEFESDEEEEVHVQTPPPRRQTVAALAEQITSLQLKLERLELLRAKFQELAWFDHDDMQLLDSEQQSTQQKLDAIKASMQEGSVAYLHVTLKRREAFLESAVRQHLLDPEKDKALFHALVKKQVYLTRLADNRMSHQQ